MNATRRLLFPGLGLALVALVSLANFGIVRAEIAVGLTFLVSLVVILAGLFKLSSGPLARLIAGWSISIRWKIAVALSAIGGLVFFSTVVNFQAMDYMHGEIHAIQELGNSEPWRLREAIDELEQTQHGPLFDLTPLLALLGAMLALGLGIGIARSVINAIHGMEQGMGRIAAGNFSEPIRVANRDELGDLAGQINAAAGELAVAREATVRIERNRALRERVAEVTMAQEDERRRISRELHDGLGPSLAAFVNRLRAVGPLVRADPDHVESELADISGSLAAQIQEIRELIHDLRPLALDQLGLVGAVEQYVVRFGREHGLRASFTSSESATWHPLVEVTVLRIVQECLSNIQKHARATHARVTLRVFDGVLELVVEDDGRGFDATAMAPQRTGNGLGLLSMQERAELVHGSVVVESRVGGGCRVALQIPLKETASGVHTNGSG